MQNVQITYQATDPQHVLTANIVDIDGNPITGLSGYNFLFLLSDNGSILTPQGPLANSGSLPVLPTGRAGTVTVTVSASKTGVATVTGQNTIAVTGPAPSGIVITSN